MQLLSLADENVVSVSGSYELFAYFFHSVYHGGTAIPHWDVTSEYLSQVRDSSVWISIRDFLFPLTFWLCARPDRNGTTRRCMGPLQLFAALWFLFIEKDDSGKGESEALPEWPSLCSNLRQRFGYHESDRWPLDDGRLREEYHFEALAFP